MNDDDIATQRQIGADVVYRLRTEIGESLESIAQMPTASLQRLILKLEQPDRAKRRLEHELGALVDDAGAIPTGSLAHAHEQVMELRAMQPPGLNAGIPIGGSGPSAGPMELTTAGLTGGLGWVELGPDNIGGRTRSILIDPTDTARIYATGVGGGIWLSIDGGITWNPTDDQMGNLAICSLAMHPADPMTILAGSGEGFGNSDAIRGDGIFITDDGGTNWRRLDATSTNPDFHTVNSLAYSPDGSVILAATRTGIHRSTDGGDTWTSTFGSSVGNLAFHPTDNNRAIAGALAGANALFTIDGGNTWTTAAKPSIPGRRIQVCYAAANPDITYASVDASPSQIWRSTDGGQTYIAKGALSGGGPASFLGQQGWYDNVIWAGDPTDPDLVVVGGIDLWRSIDGGDSLTQISTWWSDDSAHADHHVIVADPNYDGFGNRRVYFGNDGGVFRSDDVRDVGNNASPPYTNGWISLSQGFAVTQFYYGAGHIGTNTIVGGTQDNGTLRRVPGSGNQWNKVYGGDGGACASDPRNSEIWYGEYVYLNIFRNTNGGAGQSGTEKISGQFWNGSSWQWKPAPFTITDCRNSNAQFIAPFVLDPNDGDRLLGGGLSLWLTTDPLTPNTSFSGPSWTTIKAPIGAGRTQTITSIAVASGDSNVIVVGHANGDVYRTVDGTAAVPTWERIDDNGIGANRQCLDLTIDPDDHQVIFAAFGGYESSNLWRTSDGGQSWTDLSGTLPDAPFRSVSLHPQRSSWVYLATDVGVFSSEDGGQTWSASNEGPANVACRDLFWIGCDLVVATHGRGMFQIELTIANAFPIPELEFTGSQDYSVNGEDFTRYNLKVNNSAAYPDSLFRPSPDLAPCGLNNAAARTWIDIFDSTTNQRIYGFCALGKADDLQGLWFATPRGAPAPASVHVELRDRRCGQNYQSAPVEISGGTEPVARIITGVDRDGSGTAVTFGGTWGTASFDEVIDDILRGRHTYLLGEGDQQARVAVVNGRSGPYLRSYGDALPGNNLSELPAIGA